MESIIYPWDFLNLVQKVLHEEVTKNIISPNASIAKSSIIEGPCIIEDDVNIDDFCKIKGPTYIGKGSFVGMSSLIRNCMFGNETRIGFNCEIGRSYFAGHDKISHQNVILDSIIGENVWFGGYSGTANVLLTQGNIRYEISKGDLMDTGTNHFGAVVGNDSAIGASVIILPGRQVPHSAMIQAGTIFGSKLFTNLT
jgi:NDP-sugar pyrophosphorylase family protein